MLSSKVRASLEVGGDAACGTDIHFLAESEYIVYLKVQCDIFFKHSACQVADYFQLSMTNLLCIKKINTCVVMVHVSIIHLANQCVNIQYLLQVRTQF